MGFVLYTRRGCHLCEAAEDMLAGLGFPVDLVDVDRDPALRGRLGMRIPVLEIDGVAVLEGRFEPARLAALVSQAQIQPAAGERVDEAGG